MRLEINYKKKNFKAQKYMLANNMQPNNQQGTEEIRKEIKYLKSNETKAEINGTQQKQF